MYRKLFANSVLIAIIAFVGCTGDSNPTETNTENQKPQLVAIIADPLVIMPGDTSFISISASDPDLDTVFVNYEATGGTIKEEGTDVMFIANSSEGVAWITVTLNDHHGGITTGKATINVTNNQPLMSIGVQVLESSSSENPCLVFSALPAETIFFLGVIIENPIAQTFEVFGSSGSPVTPDRVIPLQEPGQCYTLHSGTYKFTFTLLRSPDENSFDFITTHIQP